jgi:hypothetical protein
MCLPSPPPAPFHQVAKEAVQAFNSDASIVAHHDNIKGPDYSIEYFRGFNLVLNALDNVSARRYDEADRQAGVVVVVVGGGWWRRRRLGDADTASCLSPPQSPQPRAHPLQLEGRAVGAYVCMVVLCCVVLHVCAWTLHAGT